MNKNNIKKIFCGRCFLMVAAVLVFNLARGSAYFCWSKSPSMTHKLFLFVKSKNIKKNSLIVFRLSPDSPTGNRLLVKRVLGTPGDVVLLEGDKMKVNDIELIVKKEKKNLSLSANLCPQVLSHHFFVVGDHEDSFDSRYHEFGLVPEDLVLGKAFVIF